MFENRAVSGTFTPCIQTNRLIPNAPAEWALTLNI